MLRCLDPAWEWEPSIRLTVYRRSLVWLEPIPALEPQWPPPAWGSAWGRNWLFEAVTKPKPKGLGLLKGRSAGLAGQPPVIDSAHGWAPFDPRPSHPLAAVLCARPLWVVLRPLLWRPTPKNRAALRPTVVFGERGGDGSGLAGQFGRLPVSTRRKIRPRGAEDCWAGWLALGGAAEP